MDNRAINAFLNNTSTVSKLSGYYQSAVKRILLELSKGVSRVGAAQSLVTLKHINAIIDSIDPLKSSKVRAWIREQMPKAYVLGDTLATQALKESLKDAVIEQFDFNNSAAMQAITAGMESTLGGAAAEMRRTIGTFIRQTQVTLLQSQKIREATVGGLIRGQTGKQLVADIERILLGRKISPEMVARFKRYGFRGVALQQMHALARGEMITVGKRRFKVASYAELVAHAQVREAIRVATIVRLQQNGIDHVQISDHIQEEVDECTPFAGKVFYIGPLARDPHGFPLLRNIINGGPPFHPFCEHVLLPYILSLRSGEQISNDLTSSRKIPRKMMGKDNYEVRQMVAKLSDKELEEIQ